MRTLFLFFILSISLLSCETTSISESGLEGFIPRKAAVVIRTTDLTDLQSQVRNNDFLNQFSDTSLYGLVEKQGNLLEKIKPEGETLFCFTKLGRDDYDVSLITEMHAGLFKGDSLLMKEASLNDKRIKSLNTTSNYLVYDGIFVASSSKLLLENIIREEKTKEQEDALFTRAYASASAGATATVFVRGSEGAALFQNIFPNAAQNALKDTFSWTAADVDLSQNDLRLNGVILTQDSTDLRLNVLKNTAPVLNRIAEITPTTATEVSAITYRDWEAYKESKATFNQMDASKLKIEAEELFETFTEVGIISLPKGQVIIGVAADALMTEEVLAGADELNQYRDIAIYGYEFKDAFAKAFTPILKLPEAKMYAVVDDFFIFGESQDVLETIIANYQNKATLSQSDVYKNTESQLSSASSYLNIKNLQSAAYKEDASEHGRKILKGVALDGYMYAATQLVQESDYMLYNSVVLKNDNTSAAGGVSQVANVKLSAAITKEPQLVKNHRTNGMDIIVQDVNNTLHLISNAGKVLWQREIDGQVLGKIQQVDLYRNGRLQLAFTTSKSLYILDRNGKDVSPYPLSFNDEITQPLAVFDYDNNRSYRFLIVQNDEILMYNKEAKPVTGFTFNKAPATVLMPPQHIRMGNKDYILIAENTGKLNILSRVGKSRITVDKNIDFGDVAMFRSGNSFQTYDVNGNKITINTNGKVSESISEFSSDSKLAVNDATVAGIRENELVIGKKKLKIPFGTYAQPTVATAGKTTYIAVTNTEAKEVTLYDSKGKSLPNFPVYGISRADVGFLERNKSLGFAVLGDARSVIIYRVN